MSILVACKRAALLSFSALILASCVPQEVIPEVPTKIATQAETPSDAAQACSQRGGVYRPVCMMGKPACVTPFQDAGKPCTDGSQCSGNRCLADGIQQQSPQAVTGKCVANSDPCGCYQTISDGRAMPAICVD